MVKRIFRLYLQGYGTPKITKLLNEEKVPPPSSYMKTKRYEKCSGKWTKSGIYKILTNEVYIGTIVSHKSYKANHKVKTRIITSKNERIYVENMHEQIIDKKTFEMVQKKLHEPIKNRDRENFNPYKKYVYCGECRSKSNNENT